MSSLIKNYLFYLFFLLFSLIHISWSIHALSNFAEFFPKLISIDCLNITGTGPKTICFSFVSPGIHDFDDKFLQLLNQRELLILIRKDFVLSWSSANKWTNCRFNLVVNKAIWYNVTFICSVFEIHFSIVILFSAYTFNAFLIH